MGHYLSEMPEDYQRWIAKSGRAPERSKLTQDEALLDAIEAARASLGGMEEVAKDDEGRPYQCGAFVSGDSRWECRLESDHESDHEWRLATPEAEPHGSEWRVPTATPSDDVVQRRAVFIWSDERGQWEMECWLPEAEREEAL